MLNLDDNHQNDQLKDPYYSPVFVTLRKTSNRSNLTKPVDTVKLICKWLAILQRAVVSLAVARLTGHYHAGLLFLGWQALVGWLTGVRLTGWLAVSF